MPMDNIVPKIDGFVKTEKRFTKIRIVSGDL